MPAILATIYYEVVPACVLALALSRPLWCLIRRNQKLGVVWLGACLAFLPIHFLSFTII